MDSGVDEVMSVGGVLNVLKPPGMTSHDVVAFARRITRIRRVGHTGTLDPGAAGVLPLCLGKATRIAEYLTAVEKTYRVEATFGVSTSTDDSSGGIIGESDASFVAEGALREALAGLKGEILQRVPPLSAKKYRGVRSYDVVRAGGEPRSLTATVSIYDICLVSFAPGWRCVAVFDVTCSSGTYVRTICSDIGRILGCGGFMSFLLRTAAGGFGVGSSLTLEELVEAVGRGQLGDVAITMSGALGFMRGFVLSEGASERLSHGNPARGEDIVGIVEPSAGPLRLRPKGGEGRPLVRLLDPRGRLLAVARCTFDGESPREFSLEKVIAGV